MAFHETAARLWKHLPREERLVAAKAFFREPAPDLAPTALDALARARRMRPQAVRALPPATQAGILATVLDPGEPLALGLLVSLHLADRRALLVAFLDALGLSHDEGVLHDEDEAPGPVPTDRLRAARGALSGFPPEHVETYLNTLWLQDPERWAGLAPGVEPDSRSSVT